MSLTKEQLGWILIRAAGVYFLVKIISTLGILVALAAFPVRKLLDEMGFGGWLSGSILVDIALCVYFLGFGKALHRLLMFEGFPPANPKRTPVSVNYEALEADRETGLMPNEFVDFSSWLMENPELKDLPKVDQVARFRDYQSE